jgi:predicted dehydrogenase
VVLTQIHDYDMAWWLFGAPRAVTATGGHLSDLEIDVEDTVDAQLEGGRVSVSVRQSMATRPPRRVISVTGEAGSVTVDLLAGRISSTPRIASAAAFADYQRNQMFVDEARHFQACLAGTESPAVPLEDGLAVLRVALAVKAALTTGRRVEIT